ncbi:c-type cytochrome [Pinibacter aurantiacus]|uniref:Cytochrome c n=1 Tax=Pinibacter aurantiacus TaxID=2851599 RepID=A0A9E2SE98_9BACT|nr:cytochrome c [Pinibacter aurantiacus]MBV4358435.1 cytochrome c [Pinibacter aurantiacus]
MKKLLLAASLLGFVACNQPQISSSLIEQTLNTNNLETQSFVINTQKDTSIKTKEGIVVQIEKGSIESSTETVTLQIKEALSLYDMIRARLLTKSDKGILSSDGMFNITTKEKSTIKKPLRVSLPTNYANKNMSLYKGQMNDSSITWTDPQPVQTKESDCYTNGKALFKASCASCHAIEKELTAPALAWVEDRWKDKDLLRAYIRNNQKVLASGDAYANYLWCKNHKMPKPVYDSLSNDQMECLLSYIRTETVNKGIPKPAPDSCLYYRDYYEQLLRKRDSLVKDNKSMAKITIIPPAGDNNNRDTGGLPIKVSPPQYNAEYYQFTIDAYGWYNIDIQLEKTEGVVYSELFVNVQAEPAAHLKAFLIIPDRKIFQEGGYLTNGKQFGFYENTGKLPLPQNTDCFIVVLGENNGKMFFGEKHFVSSVSQTIDVKVEETTQEKFAESIKKLHFEDVSARVDTAKNFSGMKAVDSELEQVKMKVEHCGFCSEPVPADSSTEMTSK